MEGIMSEITNPRTSSIKHRDSGMSLTSVAPLSWDDLSVKHATATTATALEGMQPPAVPIVTGIICVAPSADAEDDDDDDDEKEATDDFSSEEKEFSDSGSSGIAEEEEEEREAPAKRPRGSMRSFAFVKSLATAMQLSHRSRLKVGVSSTAAAAAFPTDAPRRPSRIRDAKET